MPIPIATNQLRELDAAAWRNGEAEGEVPGLGRVRILRQEPPGRRGGRFVRIYYLNGVKTTGAKLWQACRAQDEREPA